jgi:hypothetical protein
MDLEIAPVEAVVVGDDELGELDVLVLQGLDDAIELPEDEVQAAEGAALERRQLLLEVQA